MQKIIPILRFLLFPFSLFYGGIIKLRNICFDLQIIKSFNVPIASLTVGNITVGGTGKTPFINYLLNYYLQNEKNEVAVLSRGYGRKTKGFLKVSKAHQANEVGDEPLQTYRRFSSKMNCNIYVGEDRVNAFHHIIRLNNRTNVLLLDDAFQHRKIKPRNQVVLIDFNRPTLKDWMLPTGNLRESNVGLQRADHIIVTKCPEDLSEKMMKTWQESLLPYLKKSNNTQAKVFFTKIAYQAIIPLNKYHLDLNQSKQVILLTGIAQTLPLVNFLIKNEYDIIDHLQYPDHYLFSVKDLELLINLYNKKAIKDKTIVLCTEKDFVKLNTKEFKDKLRNIPLFYIPITIDFLKDQAVFDKYLYNVTHDLETTSV